MDKILVLGESFFNAVSGAKELADEMLTSIQA